MPNRSRARPIAPITVYRSPAEPVIPDAIGLVAAQLAGLAAGLRAADRADPRHEALLCLVESACRAAGALETAADDRTVDLLEEALAAARAAVTAASFALVDQGRYGTPPA
ncbi:hypothetical protein ABZ671_28615 [Micromonospora sp. NPDC006766]|uniref:hypothetical protein n=1 Tax=Micromonospora sp. NPDC006766 TaxID=3154778 RepID=UPI0033CB6E39